MSKILVTAKINPDLDGLACAASYAKLLNWTDRTNEYLAGVFGRPQAEARFLLAKYNIKDELVFNPAIDFAKFIIVDASDLAGMPKVIRSDDVIEVIDHRETQRVTEIFPNAKIKIAKVGAAATIIFNKLKDENFIIDKNLAILLYGAIFSNTLNFQSAVSSAADKAAVKSLAEVIGPNALDIIADMFAYKTEYIKNNLAEAIRDDFKVFDHNHRVGIAQIEGFDLEKIIIAQNNEIKSILQKLKDEENLKYIFLTAADIKNGHNIFMAADSSGRLFLAGTLGLIFNEQGIAKNKELLLRKQILPLLISADNASMAGSSNML